jgi:hypothetical protein
LGRRCVFPYYDADALRAAGHAGRVSLLAGISSWLGAYQPVFRWSDPLPALSEVAGLIRRQLK